MLAISCGLKTAAYLYQMWKDFKIRSTLIGKIYRKNEERLTKYNLFQNNSWKWTK